MIFAERKRRFALLLGRYKDQSDAAEQLGFGGPAPVSNLKNGNKNMGEDVALRIEKLASLPQGSLLDPIRIPWDTSLVDITTPDNTVNNNSDILHISTESGERRMDYTDVQSYELWSGESKTEVRGMTVLTKWIEEDEVNAKDLVSIELTDDSQGPRRLKGDVVAVNMNYGDKLKNDKLYAIKLGDKHTLRLVAILGSGDIKLCCSNPDYSHAEERIGKDDIGSLNILGEYFSAAIR